METKKTKQADLRSKRWMFMFVGLTLSLAATLAAFEWKTYGSGDYIEIGSAAHDFDDLVEIPQTIQEPPKPPVVKQPVLIVVDDEEVLEEIHVIIDIEITEDQVIEDIIVTDDLPEEKAEEVFIVVEDQAAFPGGKAAWGKFLRKNLKYPRHAARTGVEGKVFLSFIVDKNGIISDIKVTRGIGGGCDEEAIRVLSKSPKWSPGRQRGNAVKSRMGIQIRFQLK